MTDHLNGDTWLHVPEYEVHIGDPEAGKWFHYFSIDINLVPQLEAKLNGTVAPTVTATFTVGPKLSSEGVNLDVDDVDVLRAEVSELVEVEGKLSIEDTTENHKGVFVIFTATDERFPALKGVPVKNYLEPEYGIWHGSTWVHPEVPVQG